MKMPKFHNSRRRGQFASAYQPSQGSPETNGTKQSDHNTERNKIRFSAILANTRGGGIMQANSSAVNLLSKRVLCYCMYLIAFDVQL
jgi:hypothetical protein